MLSSSAPVPAQHFHPPIRRASDVQPPKHFEKRPFRVELRYITGMAAPTFEDACRNCDAAIALGSNFIASFRALAAVCKDMGQEAVASKAKDLLRIILCSAPMCCNASRIKSVRSVAVCVLDSGPAAAALLSTGLIKGSGVYAHKSPPSTTALHAMLCNLDDLGSFAGRSLFLHLRCSSHAVFRCFVRLTLHYCAAAAFSPQRSPFHALPNADHLQSLRVQAYRPLPALRCTAFSLI